MNLDELFKILILINYIFWIVIRFVLDDTTRFEKGKYISSQLEDNNFPSKNRII